MQLEYDVTTTLFAKTEIGQREIQSKSLGLDPLSRRALILIDGKRNFQELSSMILSSKDVEIIQMLVAKECIKPIAVARPEAGAKGAAVKDAVPVSKSVQDELAHLPPASSRSAKETEMARNFLMNTINTVFEQNTRLTLMEAIFACKTSEDVRRVYPKWVETMKGSGIGTKRLPEFREKLFKVL
ncbi:MAG: hypothetical protein U5L73_16925 [Rhodoferax sp.]|uniref:hypothetical protein n=1 Tax=Rhodoferax sp. TaxID=50421 RepID=UPI002ACD4B50|nr:hypothetical protein [Rhodoferax sp.]MDZ7893424.1 hypothetical protein [Rhodoferax sp.]